MKYVIETNDHPMNDSCTPALYRAKGFRTLVFDKHGLNKLTPFDEAVNIQEGLAWSKGYDAGHMNGKQESYDKGYDEGFEAGKKAMKEIVINNLRKILERG